MSLSSADLVAMSDAKLLKFADEVLGIPIPKGTSRNTILTRIANSSVSRREVT